MPGRTLFFYLVFQLLNTAQGQSLDQFKKDLAWLISQKQLSDTTITKFYDRNHKLLDPYFSTDSLGFNLHNFPLASFKTDSAYKQAVTYLLHTDHQLSRGIAYGLLAAANDHGYDALLKQRLGSERTTAQALALVCSVLYLRIPATTDAFLVLTQPKQLEVFPYVLPILLQQPQDSLRQTAFRFINSPEPAEKSVALQLLRYIPLTVETKEVLWKAFAEWQEEYKLMVLAVIGSQNAGEVGVYAKPFLENPKTKAMALQAIAASSFKADRQLLMDYIDRQTELSQELITTLLFSSNIENNRLSLRLLTQKNSPAIPLNYYDYLIFPERFRRDELLPDVQTALETVTDPAILEKLIPLLANRFDARSTAICLRLLKHPEKPVRTQAAVALYGNPTSLLKPVLPELLKNPALRTVELTRLAIDHHVDHLHRVYDRIYKEYPGWDWKVSALTYYMAFPKQRYLTLFRKELTNQNEPIRNKAVEGLKQFQANQ